MFLTFGEKNVVFSSNSKSRKNFNFFSRTPKTATFIIFFYPQNFEIGFVNHSDTPEMIRTAQALVGWLSS